MGAFYVNCCVRGLDQAQVLDFLRSNGRRGFVGSTVDLWTAFVTSDLEMQDEAVIKSYGHSLTINSDRLVISALCHDEDFLVVYVFRAGDLVATFNSCPGYYSEVADDDPNAYKPVLDGADTLSQEFRLGTSELAHLVPDADNVDVFDLHERWTETLGLPAYAIGVGYNDVQRGGGGPDWVAT
jgi:hypothetical protein